MVTGIATGEWYTLQPQECLLFVRPGVIKFGEFSLDCARYELLCSNRTVKLEKIPMELLTLLATTEGRLVTRQEIIKHLWGDDVFVDTEHGINTAIRKIRQALKDDPERPRFVQTVTGKGYRFIAQAPPDAAPSDVALAPVQDPQAIAPASSERKPLRWVPFLFAGGSLLLLMIFALAVNLAGLRDRLFPSKGSSRIRSIAVLPLSNLSGDASLEYFADGMTDELITMLAKNPSLRVVSRTSAMQYKGINRPIKEIARELGVDGVLEGSVSKSSNRVHMNVQLIYAPTDTHMWAESYDRDANGASSLPAEVSRAVVQEVELPSGPVVSKKEINSEAHDAYLRGRYVWFGSDAVSSRKYFEQAIQLQPDYAAAWAGLADSYVAAVAEGIVPPQPAMQKGGEAARKAVQLDDSSAEAHHSLAAYHFFSWHWREAEREEERAIQANPNLAEAHHLYSYILASQQRLDEALREQKRSMEIDPFARPWGLAKTYLQMRRFDDALAELHIRTLAGNKDGGLSMVSSEAYWFKGEYSESQRAFEKGLTLFGRPDAAKEAHSAFIKGGERAVERWGAEDAERRSRKEYVSPLDKAVAYAFMGEKEQTLNYLEQAYREHSAWLALIQNEPALDFVHLEPRYQAIVNKMGLPPAK